MPFENNGDLQKWNMANSPLEIHKYYTHKKWCVTKIAHLARSWDFKVDFLPLQSDTPINILCLILGVGSVSMVLVELQKTNNSEMPFICCYSVVGCHLFFCFFFGEVVFLIRVVPFL